ncbi:MAG: recombinase family protein [Bryobacteraceae bacterium]|nr:recombinase family protein [Bryobacteraceae bacterium]
MAAADFGAPTGLRRKTLRCAIYTRKSTEEGLEQTFNTLDAQRDAAEAFIRSQREEGWTVLPDKYDDGGFTGANMDRPALKRLLQDVRDGLVDCVMVYKVDRLTRSLLDFARIIDVLDKHGTSFVSVTQQFNTTSSLGRLTLNILLSFAQFEREMIAERTKDKMSAARRKGHWVGGLPVLGYDLSDKGAALLVNNDEAAQVRAIFDLYVEHGSLMPVVQELSRRGWKMKRWTTRKGTTAGGKPFAKNRLYNLLTNMVYIGKLRYEGKVYDGVHEAIVDTKVWQAVQDRLHYNSKTGGREIHNKYGALLKGIVRCGSCDVGMVHTYTQKAPNKLYRYYVCVNAHQNGYNQCQTRSVSAPVLEQAVVDQIRGIAANPDVVAGVVRQLDEQRVARLEGLEREKRVIERDLQRLGEETAGLLRMKGTLATDRLAELQDRGAVLERQLRDVRDQLAESGGQTVDAASVIKTLQGFDGVWSEMTPREQEKFVKTLVERVTYDGTTCTVTVGFRTAGIRQLCMEMESK